MHGGLEQKSAEEVKKKCSDLKKQYLSSEQFEQEKSFLYQKLKPEDFRLYFETKDAVERGMAPSDFNKLAG